MDADYTAFDHGTQTRQVGDKFYREETCSLGYKKHATVFVPGLTLAEAHSLYHPDKSPEEIAMKHEEVLLDLQGEVRDEDQIYY